MAIVMTVGAIITVTTAASSHRGHGPSPTTTTTSTTTTTTEAPSGNPIALGFATFQPWSVALVTLDPNFAAYQNSVGSLPDFYEWYMSWPSIGGAPLYWGSQETLMVDDHLTPVISWETDTLSLPAITAGDYDASDLAPSVALAKAYPGTLYIRLDWEMNGSWTDWNPANAAQPAGETPATYVAMWQHVVNYFRAAGVTNVKWVWAPNVDGGDGSMAAYYPGDAYVDYVGLDGYNYAYTQSAPWLTPAQVFGPSYTELEGITHKPVIITETSSVEANKSESSAGDSKAQWIQQLSTYLPSLGNVVGLCWFNQTAEVGTTDVNFGVNSSSTALTAWKKDIVDNPEYAGKLP
jgi:hypothetical protein